MASSIAITSGTYQCPICGEVEYILVVTVDDVVTSIQCLSCGYDGSQQSFITL